MEMNSDVRLTETRSRSRALRQGPTATAGGRAVRRSMLEERNQIWVLTRGCLGVRGVLVQDTIISSGVWVDLNAWLAIKAAVRAPVGWESDLFGLIVASLDRRPSGNTAGNDTCHGSGGSECRVRARPCVASGTRLWGGRLWAAVVVFVVIVAIRCGWRGGITRAGATAGPRKEFLRVL